MPLFLQSRHASFSDQAFFGLSSWPYALKLLWAPLVDALFTTRWRLGRRKSWVVPVQLLTGLIMIVLGSRLDAVFGGDGPIDVLSLTASFFALYFLVATQDIAVDGWALTMLRPENVGYAGTANTVGQSTGIVTAYGLLMALDSADFSNTYVRMPLGLPTSSVGIVTMSGFMIACGCIFIVSTLALWAFLTEREGDGSDGVGGDIITNSASIRSDARLVESDEMDGVVPIRIAAIENGARETDDEAVDFNSAPPSTAAAAVAGTRSATTDGAGVARRRTPRRGSGSSDNDTTAGVAVDSGAATGRKARRSPRPSSRGRRQAPSPSNDAAQSAGRGAAGAVIDATASNSDSSPFHANGGVDPDEEGGTDDEARALVAGPRHVRDKTLPSNGAAHGSGSGLQAALDAVAASYRDLWRVLSLPEVRSLAIVLVTAKVGFAVSDGATGLIVQARGVRKETIALFDVVSTPIQLAAQIAMSRLVAGPRPLSIYMSAYPARIAVGLVFLAFMYGMLPPAQQSWEDSSTATGAVTSAALAVFFVVSNVHALFQAAMFVSMVCACGLPAAWQPGLSSPPTTRNMAPILHSPMQISFFTRIADPRMGGTFMTLLNTISNLGEWRTLQQFSAHCTWIAASSP